MSSGVTVQYKFFEVNLGSSGDAEDLNDLGKDGWQFVVEFEKIATNVPNKKKSRCLFKRII